MSRIVAVTPSSFSALPARITSGKHAGLMTLKDEEGLARRLAADLAGKPRIRQSDAPLYNIMSYAGRELSNAQKTGVAAADFTGGQRDLLWQLIETYSVQHVVPALAAAQKERVRSGDREAVHFALFFFPPLPTVVTVPGPWTAPGRRARGRAQRPARKPGTRPRKDPSRPRTG